MRLEELGELGLIARLKRFGTVRPAGVLRGIGDDAAVFRVGRGRVVVVTTDMLVEGVHFRLGRDARRLGAKALLVNLSDLAAMGARPREALVALAAPGRLPLQVVDRFLLGFHEVARAHRVNLLGGDTSASTRDLVIAVTAIGDGEQDRLVYRSGARPGDVLYVTGTLGDSAGGLEILERGLKILGTARRRLVRAHELPRAYVREGRWLAKSGAVSAMIDLSDGLAADLPHVLAESGGLGARIEAERLPISAELGAACRSLALDPQCLALGGGEDYRLLLAVRPRAARRLERAYRRRFGEPLHPIGQVEKKPGIRLAGGGRIEPLGRAGFEHWRE